MIHLPIDDLLPQIIKAWPDTRNFLILASPGSGKTTRLPKALLSLIPEEKQVWVLVPRRLAALLAAQRVAEESEWVLGAEVGYSFRFENKVSAKTRLLFLTEGLFLKKLQGDPTLSCVQVLILDEFHERHLDTDLAISLARTLQKTKRPDLRIGVMSATISTQALSEFLQPLTCYDLQAPPHPLTLVHEPSAEKIEDAMAKAISRHLPKTEGHILAFLPGQGSIHQVYEKTKHLPQVSVVKLYGEMSTEEQKNFLKDTGKRKIILATNIAESSVTLDGVRVVIDSGLYRRASYSWWTGIPTLVTRPIAKASAIQRAGRANRQAPGVCVRLYSEHDYSIRPDYEVPEISRADLTSCYLQLIEQGFFNQPKGGGEYHRWFQEPPKTAVDHACDVLEKLGAIAGREISPSFETREGRGSYQLTELGHSILNSSLPPRLARVMLEAGQLECVEECAPFVTHLAINSQPDGNLFDAKPLWQNYMWERQYNLILKSKNVVSNGSRPWSPPIDGFDVDCHENSSNLKASICRRSLGGPGSSVYDAPGAASSIERSHLGHPFDINNALMIIFLSGFPDFVGQIKKNPKPHEYEVLLCFGGRVLLKTDESFRVGDLILVLDVREVKSGTHKKRFVTSYIPLDLAVLSTQKKLMTDREVLIWNKQLSRVESNFQITYGDIILEEDLSPASPSEEVVELLTTEGLGVNWSACQTIHEYHEACKKIDQALCVEVLAPFFARLASLQQIDSIEATQFFVSLWQQILSDCISLNDLKDKIKNLEYILPPDVRKKLAALPLFISLPGREKTPVIYSVDNDPYIESRIQDFFGLEQTPTIAGGRMKLTCHLLAPNYRAVQVTKDLAGFWERVYPELKTQLQRRYPRHKWL